MNRPVDLLLISCNRRGYLEKSLEKLLSDPSPFRLYCWDNASRDGSAETISTLNDPRVVGKKFAREDAGQREPFLWFLETSESDIVGKVDDDILVPPGWIDQLAPLLRREEGFGLLGCWTFMAEDWDEGLASPKIIEAAGSRIFRNLWIGGTAWLGRREHIIRFIKPPGKDYGVPIDQFLMTVNGLINGYPLPLLMAHHMDDPRSPHCRMEKSAFSSATARRKGIDSPEAYAGWIAADARRILIEPLDAQIRRYRLQGDRSLWGRLRRLACK